MHIADVTHYVKMNDEVDKVAQKAANTIYLVHRRTDMLPKVLTENLCSLVGNEDRLAFSVIWKVDPNTLEIVDCQYFKSIIHSKGAFTYEHASKILNDPNDNSEVANSIKGLALFAKKQRLKRIEEGALVLASNEVKFNIDFQTNTINDIRTYQTFDTSSVVEEFMLLANVWVAQKIYDTYPSCAVLRRHPPPKEKELDLLIEQLKQQNVHLNRQSSKTLGETLDSIPRDQFVNKMIRMMVTRTMNQAKYFGSFDDDFFGFQHYGLALPIYTHFTSPIRRYADVLVHRLLAAAINYEPMDKTLNNKSKIQKLCDNMNKKNRVAFFCGKESQAYTIYLYFSNRSNQEFEVSVLHISTLRVTGLSKEFGFDADISFDGKGKIDEKNQLIEIGSEIISLFDRIVVRVETSFTNYRRSVSFKFLRKAD